MIWMALTKKVWLSFMIVSMERYFAFLAGFIITVSVSVQGQNSDTKEFLFLNSDHLQSIKAKMQNPSPEMRAIEKQIREGVAYFLEKGPWSVTFTPSPAISGDPHDFFSEGPYWWPDPDHPHGPYIRKDGQRNPHRFMAHKNDFKSMLQAVSVLTIAGYLYDEPRYLQRAAGLLRVWFIDEQTRMNPNLNYAQAIRNKSPGRGVGIIETHRFPKLLEFVYILEYSGKAEASLFSGMRNLFSDYLNWLMTSENGLDEKQRPNNHGSWWCTQAAAYAQFTSREALQESIFQYARDSIIAGQFEKDGRQPHELERTRSYDYSIFNLDALALLSRMAMKDSIDLWRAKTGKGTIQTGVQWMHHYIRNPREWQHEQIHKIKKRRTVVFIFCR